MNSFIHRSIIYTSNYCDKIDFFHFQLIHIRNLQDLDSELVVFLYFIVFLSSRNDKCYASRFILYN